MNAGAVPAPLLARLSGNGVYRDYTHSIDSFRIDSTSHYDRKRYVRTPKENLRASSDVTHRDRFRWMARQTGLCVPWLLVYRCFHLAGAGISGVVHHTVQGSRRLLHTPADLSMATRAFVSHLSDRGYRVRCRCLLVATMAGTVGGRICVRTLRVARLNSGHGDRNSHSEKKC
jgi:hypothetical protein